MALCDSVDAVGGMSGLARRTEVSREVLYGALSESGNPQLSSLKAILATFGMEIAVRPKHAA